MSVTNHYAVLGAHAKMDDLEIRALYRALARLNHPDRGGDAVKFAQITAAYSATGTHKARAQLRALLSLHCPPCAACDASGARRTQRGYTKAVLITCPDCGGCGYVVAAAVRVRGKSKT